MLAKVITLSSWHFNKEAELPPTKKMLSTLKKFYYYEKHQPHKLCGPADIKGSFTGLLNRGLIDVKHSTEGGFKTVRWYVTPKGKQYLDQKRA